MSFTFVFIHFKAPLMEDGCLVVEILQSSVLVHHSSKAHLVLLIELLLDVGF